MDEKRWLKNAPIRWWLLANAGSFDSDAQRQPASPTSGARACRRILAQDDSR
jgi:hypothetical protein